MADLAKLKVGDDVIDQLGQSMNDVVRMIDEMNQVAVEGVEPMAHPMDAKQVLRPDVVTDEDHQSALLSLSSDADEAHYLVPKVIE